MVVVAVAYVAAMVARLVASAQQVSPMVGSVCHDPHPHPVHPMADLLAIVEPVQSSVP